MGNILIAPFTDLLKHYIEVNYIKFEDKKLNLLTYACMSIIVSYLISCVFNITSLKETYQHIKWFFTYRILRIKYQKVLCNADDTPYSPKFAILNDKGRIDTSTLSFYDLYDEQHKYFLEFISQLLYKNHYGSNTYVRTSIYSFETSNISVEKQYPKLQVSRKTFNSYFKSEGENLKVIAYINGYYILIDISAFNNKKRNDDDDENIIRLLSNNRDALNIFMDIIQTFINENNTVFRKVGSSGLEVLEYNTKTGSLVSLGDVKAKQTMDSFISRHKQSILSKLDAFKNENLDENNPYIENNLGFLLHGFCGTGKSHLASAIANHLKMNILVVRLSGLTKSDFAAIMKLSKTGKYIISFEEFDILLTDFLEHNKIDQIADLQMRIQMLSAQINSCTDKELVAPLVEQMKQLMENSSSNKLTYDSFLTELSGLISVSGRVMIANTNFPEKLPKALLRPGRFDINIHLGKFNENEMKEWLVKMYKPNDRELQVINKKHFPADKYTPAQLNIMALEYKNIIDMIDVLTKDNNRNEMLSNGDSFNHF